MGFIEDATGKPEKFTEEVYLAGGFITGALGGKIDNFCIYAGAGYIQKVMVALNTNAAVTHPSAATSPYRSVGSASMILHLNAGAIMVQAVNDRFTESWPLPWIIGADRRRGGFKEWLDADVACYQALYVPQSLKDASAAKAGTLAGIELVAQVAAKLDATDAARVNVPVYCQYPSRAAAPAVKLLLDSSGNPKISPSMKWCLKYPPNGTASATLMEPNGATGTVEVEKPRALVDILKERKAKARWSV